MSLVCLYLTSSLNQRWLCFLAIDISCHLINGITSLENDVIDLTHSVSLVLVLGNVVISKNFLRTRKIMVMHSNERGECCVPTLVDRSRKRYINAVDVVIRIHDLTDPSTESTAPLSSAHVRLGDVLAFSIQQEGRSSR